MIKCVHRYWGFNFYKSQVNITVEWKITSKRHTTQMYMNLIRHFTRRFYFAYEFSCDCFLHGSTHIKENLQIIEICLHIIS